MVADYSTMIASAHTSTVSNLTDRIRSSSLLPMAATVHLLVDLPGLSGVTTTLAIAMVDT